MLVLLPIIIFSAGFNLKKGDMWRNFVPIMLTAFIGTSISTVVRQSTSFAEAYHTAGRGKAALLGSLFQRSLLSVVSAVPGRRLSGLEAFGRGPGVLQIPAKDRRRGGADLRRARLRSRPGGDPRRLWRTRC